MSHSDMTIRLVRKTEDKIWDSYVLAHLLGACHHLMSGSHQVMEKMPMRLRNIASSRIKKYK